MNSPSPSNPHTEIYRHLIAVTRKVAKSSGLQRLGTEHFGASLVRVLGESANPVLAASGVCGVEQVLLRIPDATVQEGEALPPAIPDADLAKLLKGPLSGLANGEMTPHEALEALLKDKQVVLKLKELVQKAGPSDGRQILCAQTPIPEPTHRNDAHMAVRRYTNVLQMGYQLSRRRYGLEEKRGTSDFATGRCDSDFNKVLEDWESDMRECRVLLHTGPRADKRSYFDYAMRQYGPVASDVLAAVTLHSVTPFTEREAGILVRDVAWTLRPRFPHPFIPAVLEAATTLAEAGCVRILPEPEVCQLESFLLPTEATLRAFGHYLNDAAA